MTPTPERNRVAAEFIGLAHLFRSAVKTEDTLMEAALDTIGAPLNARLKLHPKLCQEQVAGAVRPYRNLVPSTFRIDGPDIKNDRAEFGISERRLIATWIHDRSWEHGDHEPGVAVSRFAHRLEDGRLLRDWTPLAVVSLHALARWLERSGRRDHAGLLTDLAVLAHAEGSSDKIVTLSGGLWLCSKQRMRGREGTMSARNVRTWIAS